MVLIRWLLQHWPGSTTIPGLGWGQCASHHYTHDCWQDLVLSDMMICGRLFIASDLYSFLHLYTHVCFIKESKQDQKE